MKNFDILTPWSTWLPVAISIILSCIIPTRCTSIFQTEPFHHWKTPQPPLSASLVKKCDCVSVRRFQNGASQILSKNAMNSTDFSVLAELWTKYLHKQVQPEKCIESGEKSRLILTRVQGSQEFSRRILSHIIQWRNTFCYAVTRNITYLWRIQNNFPFPSRKFYL
jgi:hypothetical protein